MLPNHAPLVIAEQFGTLESLFPGRIDLGLGRAPGTDQRDRARAAPHACQRSGRISRRTCSSCMALLPTPQDGQAVRAVPGAGLRRADLDPRVEPVRRAGGGRCSGCRSPSRRISPPRR